MSLLVTIFLMLVNIGNSERSNMPDAETMTAMDVWILSCMAFLAAALLEYSTLIWLTFSPPAFLEREAFRIAFSNIYRMTHQNGKNLLLTLFRQFRQLVGNYCF